MERPSAGLELPHWAQVSERRLGHIARVTALMDRWARELRLVPADAQAFHDAGRWHDALKDAPTEELHALVGPSALPESVLHGPAAAARLEQEGEARSDVLEAIRWHTLGFPEWGRVGRALFMADFLEPGRPFAHSDRAFLAAHVAHDFDGVFRQVLRMRIEWTVREGKSLFPQTVDLWNRLR